MDLLVIGTIAFDSVETPFGAREKTLGGSASFISTAASYFCQPKMVGIVGDDFPDEHIDFFRHKKIDTQGIQITPGKTFYWSGYYDTNLGIAQTKETQLNVLTEFDPKLPPSYIDAEVVALGNIDPSLQLQVLKQLRAPQLVAADTMNYWIEGAPKELRKTLAHVDLLSINDGEARQLSGEYNLVKAAEAIRAMGPKILVIKRGEHGATIFTKDTIFMAPAFPIMTIQDPTGAGDSFAGGMLGYLARCGSFDVTALRQAVVIGSTMASFAVEDFSLDRFRTLTHDEVRLRFSEFQQLTHFESVGASIWNQ